jgi:hypothetical protein
MGYRGCEVAHSVIGIAGAIMPNFQAHANLYDWTDVFEATGRRVNSALLRSWIQQRRIRTPLLDAEPGKPRLFWFGNVLEIDLISLATRRGIAFDAVGNPSAWFRRVVQLPDGWKLILCWQQPTAPPEAVVMRPGDDTAAFMASLVEKGGSENSITMIDVSERMRTLERTLAERLAQREERGLLTYPTLTEKLTELRRSHELHRQLAEEIMSFG